MAQRKSSQRRQRNSSAPFASFPFAAHPLTEELYRSVVAQRHPTILLFPPGGTAPIAKSTPPTFKELCDLFAQGWSIETHKLSHPVMQFLVELDLRAPFRVAPGFIIQNNLKACGLAYALLGGSTATDIISASFQTQLGDRLIPLISSPDLRITWTSDAKYLELTSGQQRETLEVTKVDPQAARLNSQPIASRLGICPQRTVAAPARARLGDNAYGKIEDIFIVQNAQVRYRTLREVLRSIDAKVHVLLYPADELLQLCRQSIVELENHGVRRDETVLAMQQALEKNASAPFAPHIQALHHRDSNDSGTTPCAELIAQWMQLHRQLFQEIGPKQVASLQAKLHADNISSERVSILLTDKLDSRWARDYFLIGSTPSGERQYFESSLPLRATGPIRNRELLHDIVMAPATRSSAPIVDIQLPLDGGDMRAVGQTLFIGRNTFEGGLQQILTQLQEGKTIRLGHQQIAPGSDATQIAETLKAEYQEQFGRVVVVVGEGLEACQPLMHIDMFASFLPGEGDKLTVVIGDTLQSLSILEGLAPSQRIEIERAMLAASLDPVELSDASDLWVYHGAYMDHDLIASIQHVGLSGYIRSFRASPERASMQIGLDAYAQWFESRGYDVVRSPTLAHPLVYFNAWTTTPQARGKLSQFQDSAQRLYNNVLVEAYIDDTQKTHRNVYVPGYGIQPLEDRIREIYAELGYHTQFIPFLWEAACGNGGLDCLSSEIRGPVSTAMNLP